MTVPAKREDPQITLTLLREDPLSYLYVRTDDLKREPRPFRN